MWEMYSGAPVLEVNGAPKQPGYKLFQRTFQFQKNSFNSIQDYL